MELKWSWSPLSLHKSLKLISVTIWPGCTELTPMNQMQPLISEWGLSGGCQTSWWQLPCPSPSGSCPQIGQWQSFPIPVLVCPFSWPLKSKGPAGDTVFWCAPGYSMFTYYISDEGLELICLTIVRIHRLVCFWFFLSSLLNLFWFHIYFNF